MRSDCAVNPPSSLGVSAGELTDVKDLRGESLAAFRFLSDPTIEGTLGSFGAYTVMRFLGSGAAGFVFLAEDPELHRPMAIKILRPELAADPDHRNRFLREARSAAALVSDHTVPIYYVGEIDGLPYLAMMYLAGETLQARLGRKGHLRVPAALEIARQVALGLADAHAHGLIHRDIKPANLWLEADRDQTPGAVRRVRILDFGLARTLDPTDASGRVSSAIVGTPQFMSPEQADGTTLDSRSDLFGLGSVLYAMLVGSTPFQGSNLSAILHAVATKDPPALHSLDGEIPEVVSDFVMKLLAKDREHRPATAYEVADQLTGLLQAFPPDPRRLDRSASPSQDRNSFLAHSSVRCVSDPTVPMTLELPTPPRKHKSRRVVLACSMLAILAAVLGIFWLGALVGKKRNPVVVPAPASVEPIYVGVLHSRTGTMAVSEEPVIDATLLAIEEINVRGGVLGRPVKPIVVDGQSKPESFAVEAEKLLVENKVSAIFGCWTSASRKAVKPIIERNGGLLFYPVQYEGLELSPRIVYTGPTANQQLIPAFDFIANELKSRRLYLVGSDYVFPRTAHAILRDRAKSRNIAGLTIVGEQFRPLGENDWASVVANIIETKPDAILNTINGGSAFGFYKQLRRKERELGREPIPIVSVSLAENEMRGIDPTDSRGDYLVGSYFQNVSSHESKAFVEKIRTKYGAERNATDMMAAAYDGVMLWKQAVERAETTQPDAVIPKLRGATITGPRGSVLIDAETLHTWLPTRIAKVGSDGQLQLLPRAATSIKPIPYPETRTPAEWNRFLTELYLGWNGHWQAPQPKE